MIYGFLYFNSSGSDIHGDSGATGSRMIPINLTGREFLPKGGDSDIVHHAYYTVGYNPKKEIPDWVAYKLTKESLVVKNVPRAKRFIVDNDVEGKSAKHSDYTHSGYTRGHMAPAGDMAFSEEAMRESFYMSNMTPQLRAFNGGIWRELEENVRDWAYDNDELYIVSGPIFYDDKIDKIGKSTQVAVPDAFYKAILDIEGRSQKSIGFIIPHEKSDKHLREYAVSIDEVERVANLNFFNDLIQDNNEEEQLEQSMDVNKWRVDKKRFNQRVSHWNKEK